MVEDVDPKQVWEALRSDDKVRLVDVRTDAEWAYVGLPDLEETGSDPVLIPWQLFPGMQVNGRFMDHVRNAGLTPENKIYFLCRSGVRSTAAAQAAVAAGFPHAYNIKDGFEGPPDAEGHRGKLAGWKAEGLPWRQR
jgi:rhodanese-related sulfurtransferase